MTAALTIDLPPELINVIAEQVAGILAERKGPTEDRWIRGAQQIADYIASTPSRVYALNSAGRLPAHKDGSALVARCSELDDWIKEGGDCCPAGRPNKRRTP